MLVTYNLMVTLVIGKSERCYRKHHSGVSWPMGLVHQTQALVLSAVECGFESLSRLLCPYEQGT